MKSAVIVSTGVLLLAGCSSGESFPPSPSGPAVQEEYRASIDDAAVVRPDEVVNTLVPLTSDNPQVDITDINGVPHVRLVNWASETFGESPNETLPMPTHVWTVLPQELRSWCAQDGQCNTKTDADLTLRLEQLLGEPPNSGKTLFIEMLVPLTGVLRPCFDTSITTTSCPGTQTSDQPAIDSDFLWSQTVSAYFISDSPTKGDNGWPWTRLGYTYDWATDSQGWQSNNPHVGLSEFVIDAGTTVTVTQIASTRDYVLG